MMRRASAAAKPSQERVSSSIAVSMPKRSSAARYQHPSWANQFLANISSARRRALRPIESKAVLELLLMFVSPRPMASLRLQQSFDLRSEEHTSELQSLRHLVCRLLL